MIIYYFKMLIMTVGKKEAWMDQEKKKINFSNNSVKISNFKLQFHIYYFVIVNNLEVQQFKVKSLNNTTVFLQWIIQNATNPFDMNRILSISTVHDNE